VISYIGGKNRMAEWISSYIPECETYVEVFGGAFWVYVNSDIHERTQNVIYNDFNPYMVNLFRCASEPKKFMKFIESKNPPVQTKGQPELSRECNDFFYQCKKEMFGRNALKKFLSDKVRRHQIATHIHHLEGGTSTLEKIEKDILSEINYCIKQLRERTSNSQSVARDKIREKIQAGKKDQSIAMKYAYILASSFSGVDPVDAEFQDYKGMYGSKFTAFTNRLTSDKFIPKLKKIHTCENMSFEEVIAKYDSPTTYFYVDPPYWNTESYYSLHEFGREQHYQLRDSLHGISGKFSLSYYDFDELSEMYPKNDFVWERREFVKPAGAKEGVDQGVGEELLIMNYNNV